MKIFILDPYALSLFRLFPFYVNNTLCFTVFKLKATIMTRSEIYKDIEQMFGLVPTFMKMVPDSTLELEWELFKKVAVEESVISNKNRELIGIGISAVTKCKYCIFFHTEMARLFGATDEEIENAVHYAKNSSGWSAYINGLQLNYEQFKDEITNVCDFVRAHQKTAVHH